MIFLLSGETEGWAEMKAVYTCQHFVGIYIYRNIFSVLSWNCRHLGRVTWPFNSPLQKYVFRLELFFDSYFSSAFYSICHAHTQILLSFSEGWWSWKEKLEAAFHLHSLFSFSLFPGEDSAHRKKGFSEIARPCKSITFVPSHPWPSPRPWHGHYYPLFVATDQDIVINYFIFI